MKQAIFFFFLSVACISLSAQTIQVLDSSQKASFRGLSVVNDNTVWVSGSNGTVGLSTNAGKNWKWMTVKGFEKRDFRDIEAFDENTAIVIAIAEPAQILKTTDAGEHWKVVFTDTAKGMFLDAMEFWNAESGIVIGDPINGKIFVARTFDGGEHWRGLPDAYYPTAETGEAMFASSGTNIRKLAKDEACFITGGTRSRLFIRDQKIDLPIIQGKESTGANSIAVWDKKTFVIVGGDFANAASTEKNCVLSKDGGKTFVAPTTPPLGYRSCVEYLSKTKLVTCGITGVDFSVDGGMNWKNISSQGFHVVRKAKKGKAVFLAGGRGKIGLLIPQLH
ncbi:MAG: oxidoreductase [Chitinophagaceae bacterium]|nr:oxidoreductase [Chitinophagaceae bacterium]